MSSEPGDFIGLGRDYSLTAANGVFFTTATSTYISTYFSPNVGYDWWVMEFAAPPGGTLAPGPYFDASSPGRYSDGPTLSIGGNSHACESQGAFLIKRFERDAGGSLAALWVTFEQTCDGSSSMLRGELRIGVNPMVALAAPVEVKVEKGLPLAIDVSGVDSGGGPVTLSAADLPPGADFADGGAGTGMLTWETPFYGVGEHDVQFMCSGPSGRDQATTRIAVTGITSIFLDGLATGPGTPSSQLLLTPREGDVSVQASDGFVSVAIRRPFTGPSADVMLGGPDGAPLTPGLYVDATPDRQPGHPLLSWACAGAPASFEVFESRFTPSGRLLALHATFEASCPDLGRTRRGEVRYMADIPFLLRAPARIVAAEEKETLFPVRAYDVEGSVATLATGPLPDGASFLDAGDSKGEFRWTPAHGQAGLHTVTFTAEGGGRRDVVPAILDVRLRNDDFDQAFLITTLQFQDAFDSSAATTEESDPICPAGNVLGNVWYRLTVSTDTIIELSTFGSHGTVEIGVYEGDRDALSEVACEFERVRLEARAGVTYHIQLAALGRFAVRFEVSPPPPPPANDDYDRAVVIDALPFTTQARNDAATRAPDDPDCAAVGKTIWYTWTAPEDLFVRADPHESEFQTSASVWTGTRDALAPVSCSGSTTEFRAVAGETYHFMIGAVEDIIGGHVVLRVTAAPIYRIDLALDRSGIATPRSGIGTVSGTVACSAPGTVRVVGTVTALRGSAPPHEFEAWVECHGATRFTAAVGEPASPVSPGWADVQARADGYEPDSRQSASDSISTRVLLTPRPGAGRP